MRALNVCVLVGLIGCGSPNRAPAEPPGTSQSAKPAEPAQADEPAEPPNAAATLFSKLAGAKQPLRFRTVSTGTDHFMLEKSERTTYKLTLAVDTVRLEISVETGPLGRLDGSKIPWKASRTTKYKGTTSTSADGDVRLTLAPLGRGAPLHFTCDGLADENVLDAKARLLPNTTPRCRGPDPAVQGPAVGFGTWQPAKTALVTAVLCRDDDNPPDLIALTAPGIESVSDETDCHGGVGYRFMD